MTTWADKMTFVLAVYWQSSTDTNKWHQKKWHQKMTKKKMAETIETLEKAAAFAMLHDCLQG